MKRVLISIVGLFVAFTSHAQSSQFDVNRDGKVNVQDAVMLVNHILTNHNDGENAEEGQLRPLKLIVSENPLVMPDGAKVRQHRAPAVFTNSLDHFYINMMYYDGDFWWNTDRSETRQISSPGGFYENNGYWPPYAENDDSVTVFGYYSYYKHDVDFFELNDGKPYLKVITEESSDDQVDVIVAKNVDTWNNCQGLVYLNFDHVCSALQFSVIKTATLADYIVEVNEIVLHNIHESGKYALLTNEWYDVDVDGYNNFTNFTLKAHLNGVENAIIVDLKEETPLGKNEDDYLFLIPQNITGMAKGTAIVDADNAQSAYLEIKCKIYDGNNIFKVGAPNGSPNEFGSVYLPFSASLTAGHIHPFTISIGTAIRDAQGNKIFN